MFKQIRSHMHLKLTLVLLVLLLLFSGCMALFLHEQSVISLEREAIGRLEQMARASGNEINLAISNTMQITDLLSQVVAENFDPDLASLDVTYMDSRIAEHEPFVRGIAQDFSFAKTAYLYYNWELDGQVHDLYFVDHDNDGQVSRQNQLPREYFTDVPMLRGDKSWWFGPIEAKNGYWSPPYLWTFDDGSTTQFMSYTKAVYLKEQLISVVGTDFKYENLVEILDKIKVYESGFPFLINDQNVFLIHPTLEGQSLSSPSAEMYAGLETDLAKMTEGVFRYRAPSDEKWLVAYYKLLNNWTVGLVAPLSEVTISARRLTIWLMVISALAIPLIAAVSYATSKRLIRPIIELTDTVRHMEEGRYTTKMSTQLLDRSDEIGVLGLAIQQMGFTIDEKINEITQKSHQIQSEIFQKQEIMDRFNLVYEAFGAAQNGMLITDGDFVILQANPSFSRLTEFSDEPIGLSLDVLLQEITHDPNLYLPKEPFYHKKLVIRRSDCPNRYLWLIMTRIESKDGHYQYIGVLEDQTETIHQAQSIEYLKDHDAQTGLLNKSAAIQEIQHSLRTAIDRGGISALMTLNIDEFRKINEALGYGCGDAVINEVSIRLKASLGPGQLLARTAGDEFLIFMTSVTHLQEIEAFGYHLIQAASRPIRWKEKDLFITLRAGVAVYPFDSDQLDTLFDHASTALSSGKDSGRGSLCFYAQDMADSAFEKYELSNQLREALEKREFFLVYQPIVDLKTFAVVGAEALIRWNHSTKGLISPDRFIPLAESNGTIDAIGQWVVEDVCRLLAEWSNVSNGLKAISINLSSLQLNSVQFAEKMFSILTTYNIRPDQINMEITESALILQDSIASKNLENLKKIGFEIHIDDFGTGFSSLAYLRDYHIDILKIDRSFIQNIPSTDTGDIAHLIINLSKSMGIKVIAEGVETKAQLEDLIAHGCDYVQGYYFSKPVSPEALCAYIDQTNRAQ